VREVENIIERALILSPGRTLLLDESLGLTQGRGVQNAARLEAVEREHILRVLVDCGWRVKGKGNAAERLGLNPSTLRFRMKKLGIERSSDH
jgi:transcriptional regulator of acetoin/glycerol metabolism